MQAREFPFIAFSRQFLCRLGVGTTLGFVTVHNILALCRPCGPVLSASCLYTRLSSSDSDCRSEDPGGPCRSVLRRIQVCGRVSGSPLAPPRLLSTPQTVAS